MMNVEDLRTSSISDMVLRAANPVGLPEEEKIVPEGQTIDYLAEEDQELFYNMLREKMINLMGQRRVILNVIDEEAFHDHAPEQVGAYSNEEQLLDYIVQEIWPEVSGQVREMEEKWLKEKGLKLKDSTVLERVTRYANPDKMPSFKKAARNTNIGVNMFRYDDCGSWMPLVRQTADKTPDSTANKWGEKLAERIVKDEPIINAREDVNDYVKAMIVTRYGSQGSGPFAPPENGIDAQDIHQRIMGVLVNDPRTKVVDFVDYYEKGDTKINFQRLYVKTTPQIVASDKNRKVIRYPEVYSEDDVISLVLIDSRNYFSYFFGEEGHPRAKMKGHRYSVHKDNFNLGKEGEKLRDMYASNLKHVLETATRVGGM